MSQSEKSEKKGGLLASYLRDFGVLKETRSEYWGIQGINFLDMAVFFAMATISVIMLSEDMGFSDETAGYVYTVYSVGTTIFLITFAGVLTDWLGIRRSLFLALGGETVSRGMILTAAMMPSLPFRRMLVWAGFILMGPFVAMMQTCYQAANKRFTTKRSRGAGFNLWYVFMNIGATIGGLMIDLIRKVLKWHNAHVFSFGVIAGVACMGLTATFVRREEQLYGDDEEPEPAPNKKTIGRKPWSMLYDVISTSAFWRFMVLATAVVGVRAVFLYLHLLLPKYWLRIIGEDAAIGTLSAINPILVVAGLILLIPILNRFNVYNMLVYGAMVSAASLFVLAYPALGSANYIVSIIFLLVLTVGEVVWSPRLQEYTAAIAPKGQEGTYLGLSMAPYFFAKIAVSSLSGHMLAKWVPTDIASKMRDGVVGFWDSPGGLWVILGIAAFAGPIIALLFRGWFTRGASFDKKNDD